MISVAVSEKERLASSSLSKDFDQHPTGKAPQQIPKFESYRTKPIGDRRVSKKALQYPLAGLSVGARNPVELIIRKDQ